MLIGDDVHLLDQVLGQVTGHHAEHQRDPRSVRQVGQRLDPVTGLPAHDPIDEQRCRHGDPAHDRAAELEPHRPLEHGKGDHRPHRAAASGANGQRHRHDRHDSKEQLEPYQPRHRRRPCRAHRQQVRRQQRQRSDECRQGGRDVKTSDRGRHPCRDERDRRPPNTPNRQFDGLERPAFDRTVASGETGRPHGSHFPFRAHRSAFGCRNECEGP